MSSGGVVASAIALGILTLAGSMAPAWIAFGQEKPRPSFEVVSIKPAAGDERQQRWELLPGGRYTATSITLKWLLLTAYNLSMSPNQLSGGPGWLDSSRYDIEARAGDGAVPRQLPETLRDEQIRLMLQTLLEDHFKVALHREPRELPVYSLITAKNGAKLQKTKIAEADCGNAAEAPVVCHGFTGGQARGLHGDAVATADLAYVLSAFVRRPVVDMTGLKGLFDIDTEGWSPLAPTAGEPADEQDTIFSVIEQQLGLKLEPAKSAVEVIVIDHAEKPDAN